MVPAEVSTAAVALVPSLRQAAEAARSAGPERGLWIAGIAKATVDVRSAPILSPSMTT